MSLAGDLLLEGSSFLPIACFVQLADEGRAGGEANALANLASSQAEAIEMCDLPVPELPRAESSHTECGDDEEVEAVQALVDREPGLSDTAFGDTSFAIQEVNPAMRSRAARSMGSRHRHHALPGDAIALARPAVQAQPLQVIFHRSLAVSAQPLLSMAALPLEMLSQPGSRKPAS